MAKKILCIDFDGVLHEYKSGWKGMGVVADGPTPGAIEWLWSLISSGEFEVCIYSSRSKDPDGLKAMKEALHAWAKDYWWNEHPMTEWGASQQATRMVEEELKFPTEKPAAFLTIDDRAICFKGSFDMLTVKTLADFKPWNKR